MTNLAQYTLQKAVYDELSADSELAELVTGIYDNPEPLVNYPYLVFGRLVVTDWSTKTTSGLQTVIDLHAYSQSSKAEVINILDRVFELLQAGGLVLEGHELIAMRFDYNEIILEEDGITYHGVIRFRAYTESLMA